jgi:hypothetical protein
MILIHKIYKRPEYIDLNWFISTKDINLVVFLSIGIKAYISEVVCKQVCIHLYQNNVKPVKRYRLVRVPSRTTWLYLRALELCGKTSRENIKYVWCYILAVLLYV